MASLTPAPSAISFVVVPLNPLRENSFAATETICRRLFSPVILQAGALPPTIVIIRDLRSQK
jgi:hypothetical protein